MNGVVDVLGRDFSEALAAARWYDGRRMATGLHELDERTRGIGLGSLWVLAASPEHADPRTIALKIAGWVAGDRRRVTVLDASESVEVTLLQTLALQYGLTSGNLIDPQQWQHNDAIVDLESLDDQFHLRCVGAGTDWIATLRARWNDSGPTDLFVVIIPDVASVGLQSALGEEDTSGLLLQDLLRVTARRRKAGVLVVFSRPQYGVEDKWRAVADVIAEVWPEPGTTPIPYLLPVRLSGPATKPGVLSAGIDPWRGTLARPHDTPRQHHAVPTPSTNLFARETRHERRLLRQRADAADAIALVERGLVVVDEPRAMFATGTVVTLQRKL